MLYVFGAEQVGVVVGDLYFVDPASIPGQIGAEHGVRVELRILKRGPLLGSIYAATPIEVDQPIWRVDLLEAIGGQPFDRTHHHPIFNGWVPCERVFVKELSADPLRWLGDQLADLDRLLVAAGKPPTSTRQQDAAELRRAAPEIVAVTKRMLDRVRAGEIGNPPKSDQSAPIQQQVMVRSGWL